MENEADAGTAGSSSISELLFDQLPPLGSTAYLELLRTATPTDLPAEVLVRAYRQLPLGSSAGRATLDRLFALTGSRWDYLGLLATVANQQLEKQATKDRATEFKDLMQDAILCIIEVLHGPRGAFAETSWAAFCYQRFFDAWRHRYGRKGENLKPLATQRISPTQPNEDEHDVIYELAIDASLWPVISDDGRNARIEAIAHEVMASLDDPLARQVAQALWCSSERPKVSGRGTAAGGPSLMQRFPGQSRDQLNRLIRRIEAPLAAALLADESLQWSKEQLALLRNRKGQDK